ncbi:hypothetical protein GMRT_21723 [Giardia muris]|uniref:Uncharacterized protein n=1 Tax=Giardia muris TaxID=5742 RepID=A0A4Z1SX51_GIAMU|nr:hypothetical protein GMRT_21723 [Giardia muris]|eukprot:TNJ28108.1 hypothetical protein GMRT_21723 [Giardia muris]
MPLPFRIAQKLRNYHHLQKSYQAMVRQREQLLERIQRNGEEMDRLRRDAKAYVRVGNERMARIRLINKKQLERANKDAVQRLNAVNQSIAAIQTTIRRMNVLIELERLQEDIQQRGLSSSRLAKDLDTLRTHFQTLDNSSL